TPVPTQEEAEKRTFNAEERAHIQSQRSRLVHGSPETCREKLLKIAAQFAADELMVLTITGDYATRLESYELLAKAFELSANCPIQALDQDDRQVLDQEPAGEQPDADDQHAP